MRNKKTIEKISVSELEDNLSTAEASLIDPKKPFKEIYEQRRKRLEGWLDYAYHYNKDYIYIIEHKSPLAYKIGDLIFEGEE